MARGWRLYPEYEREDWGHTLRSVLRSLDRSAGWLATQSNVNKGTISEILNGHRACPPDQRRRITRALEPLLEQRERSTDIEQLVRSAGLIPDISDRSVKGRAEAREAIQSSISVTAAVESPGLSGEDALLVFGEGLRFRNELDQVFLADERFKSVAGWAATSGHTRLEARALLNLAYLRFEVDDLASAARTVETAVRSACANDLLNMAAEAKQLQGRIALRRENHDEARIAFVESNALLRRLGAASKDITANWPANLPRVGHSFVISPDVQISEVVLRAGNLHFLGKTDLLQLDQNAIPLGILREQILARGSGYLDEAHALDFRSDAGHHVGFDLVVQCRLLIEMGQPQRARRLLDESRPYLRGGAFRRNWLRTRAYLTAAEGGSLCRAFRDVDTVRESPGWSPASLAELYESVRQLYWQYRPKSWKVSALRYGFAAMVLQPYPSYVRRFSEAFEAVREDEGRLGRSLRIVADELMDYGGEFAPVGELVGHLGPDREKTIRNRVNEALARGQMRSRR